MHTIDKLLNNYFEGKTSLEEQKTLERYFSGNDVAPTHEMYKSLFIAFAKEKQVKAPQVTLSGEKEKKEVRLRKVWISVASVAAIGLLLIALLPMTQTQSSHCTVIINGEKVSDPESACEYAEKMFAEADEIIETSYQPFQSALEMEKDLDSESFFKKANQTISKINSTN